jgi:hypothetical protein
LTPYRAYVRGIEIVVETLEELDLIIDRYGSTSEAEVFAKDITSIKDAMARDAGILRQFLMQGDLGLPSEKLARWFGIQGKGLPSRLLAWAKRIGLNGKFGHIFERTVYRGQRGFRLTEKAMNKGRQLLE